MSSTSSSSAAVEAIEEPQDRTDISQLKEGDYACYVQYYRVRDDQSAPHSVSFIDQGGAYIDASNAIVKRDFYTSTQFHGAVITCSQTEITLHFMEARDSVFTVWFEKKLAQAIEATRLQTLLGDEEKIAELHASKRKCSSYIRAVLGKKELRKLVGHLHHTSEGSVHRTEMGRIDVIDLEIFTGLSSAQDTFNPVECAETSRRQVDPRTIKKLILRNRCYILKGWKDSS